MLKISSQNNSWLDFWKFGIPDHCDSTVITQIIPKDTYIGIPVGGICYYEI